MDGTPSVTADAVTAPSMREPLAKRKSFSPCQSHADLLQVVQPGTADAVMFNFGWLPGADHAVFSTASSSIPALQAALEAVRPGGVVSAILYSGQVIGTDEKQTVLEYLRALPLKSFTVLVGDVANGAETAPLPCIILKK